MADAVPCRPEVEGSFLILALRIRLEATMSGAERVAGVLKLAAIEPCDLDEYSLDRSKPGTSWPRLLLFR